MPCCSTDCSWSWEALSTLSPYYESCCSPGQEGRFSSRFLYSRHSAVASKGFSGSFPGREMLASGRGVMGLWWLGRRREGGMNGDWR